MFTGSGRERVVILLSGRHGKRNGLSPMEVLRLIPSRQQRQSQGFPNGFGAGRGGGGDEERADAYPVAGSIHHLYRSFPYRSTVRRVRVGATYSQGSPLSSFINDQAGLGYLSILSLPSTIISAIITCHLDEIASL